MHITFWNGLKVMKKIEKRIKLVWQKGLYLKPEPLPRTRSFWIMVGLLTLAVTAYIIYFRIFLTTKENAFKTNGEDLGIMDQAIWSLFHGSLFHQSICNTLTDTNCFGLDGTSRFAIHFEPILFPISLLYLVWADPKTLIIFQVLVVASGAFPAFWLARLRLRYAWAAVPFALLYLLYPAQQYAISFDFLPETLTAALLLFTFYFLYTRKTLWLFVFVVLCLACKEEIAGIIAMLGLWALLLQRRWRVGVGLVTLAIGWTVVGLIVVNYSSPIGHSLLASRYSYLGNSPVQVALTILTHPLSIIKDHVLEASHKLYLYNLLAPAGFLPLLAPWVFVLAAPTLALNLLSSAPNMYSGDFQYNAEIVPILVFASIEAVVLIVWAVRWLLAGPQVERESQQAESPSQPAPARVRTLSPAFLVQTGVLALIACCVLVSVFHSPTQYNPFSAMPYARGFHWPSVTAHNRQASQFLAEIPADASVSTQTTLVPHLSERQHIYLFPYAVGYADYVLLDATGYVYPFNNYADYAASAKGILEKRDYGIVDMGNSYLLLKRGYPVSNITAALHMIDEYTPTS